jgi:hypothetical protein
VLASIGRILAAATVCAVLAGVSDHAFASIDAPSGAASHAVSFVGNYTAHSTFLGLTNVCGISVKSDGTMYARCSHQSAHWSASGMTITIIYKNRPEVETLKGTKTATGISSKAHPGTITDNSGHHGTWYAIKD